LFTSYYQKHYTMIKIVFLDAATIGDTSLESIAKQGELVCYQTSTPEETLQRVSDCDVVITNKVRITKEVLDAAPKLKLVCEAATGVNNIDLEACKQRSIPVRNVAGYSTDSVVQSTFMHLLSLLGNAPYFDNVVKSGDYSRSGLFTDVSMPFFEITGKTLGIVGMGNIGSKVAALATAFGMKVIYYSTSGTGHCKDYPCVTLEELMSCSDAISVHAPYNEKTAGLIGEAQLRLMKPTAFILNLGRGGIIVENDLAKVIDEGVIAGAALDVFEKEPICENHPLLHTRHPERLRFTPHTAWASVEARGRLIESVAKNIEMGF